MNFNLLQNKIETGNNLFVKSNIHYQILGYILILDILKKNFKQIKKYSILF